MTIVKELYKTRNDGVKLYRTFSDQNFTIHKIGTDEIYEEAIDVESATYEYEETGQIIEGYNESDLKAQAYDILIGEVE